MNDPDPKDPAAKAQVADFRIVPPDESKRRALAAAQDLARPSRPPGEWQLYYVAVAERYGIPSAEFAAIIEEIIAQREKTERKAKTEDREREQRVERERTTAQREQKQKEREQERARKEEERQRKEEERKSKEREKGFKAISKLPRAEHEAHLAELARRLGEELDSLRDEFAAFIEVEDSLRASGYVEPWDEPVATAALLAEVTAQQRRFVVMPDDVATAVSLWTLFSWTHNEIAVYSPLLVLTSVEPASGKSTLLIVLKFLTPQPYHVVEMTGPGLFHIVDRLHPTLLVEDADKLFERRPDLKHIANAAWTKQGAKVPRVISGVIREFDVFCPKVLDMMGLALPNTTASRSIICTMLPKLPSEKVEAFSNTDDESFAVLRRKLVRWSQDNLAALQSANPIMPSELNNRPAANWRLLLAIADLAGEGKRAREAAVRLSRDPYDPSPRVQLLAAMRMMFATRTEITSEDVVTALLANPDAALWHEYRGRAAISKFQVAALLKPWIRSVVLHPGGRADCTRHGYRLEQFEELFRRFLPPQVEHSNTRRRKK